MYWLECLFLFDMQYKNHRTYFLPQMNIDTEAYVGQWIAL